MAKSLTYRKPCATWPPVLMVVKAKWFHTSCISPTKKLENNVMASYLLQIFHWEVEFTVRELGLEVASFRKIVI